MQRPFSLNLITEELQFSGQGPSNGAFILASKPDKQSSMVLRPISPKYKSDLILFFCIQRKLKFSHILPLCPGLTIGFQEK